MRNEKSLAGPFPLSPFPFPLHLSPFLFHLFPFTFSLYPCPLPLSGRKEMRGFAEYEQYDALGLADLVRRKEVTPSELLEAAIERVEARNPAVNAVVMKLYDYGRKAIADGLPDGPFRGVPLLMKDLTSPVAGVRMTRGSKFFADTPPSPADSEHVKRLKRAGLVIFGRTNTCELGLSLTCEPQLHGPTRNPWNVAHISGGSSGGAAAAVAARMLPIAHASDGFGSIRAPAACCGLVGLKPTRGRNTFAPFAGEGLGGVSTEHAVSLTVRDSAALLDATRGPGPGDPYVAPAPVGPYLKEVGANPGELRIAWTTRAPNDARIEPECLRLLAEIVELCADLGHHVEERDPEIDGAAVVPTFLTLASANTVVNLASHPAAGRQMAAFHSEWDVLLTPGLASPAVKLGWLDMMMDDVDEYWRRVFAFSPFTVWFNLTGQPGLMLPLGQSSGGLPLAVQLVAPYGGEATLFRLGAQLEAARPWFGRKPALAS